MAQDEALLYATFRTERAHYVCDTYGNQFLAIPEDRWENLNRLVVRAQHCGGANAIPAEGQVPPEKINLDASRSQSYFRPTVIDRMAFADTDAELLELLHTWPARAVGEDNHGTRRMS